MSSQMQETTDNFGVTDVTARLDRDNLREGWAGIGQAARVATQVKMGAKTDLGRVRENNEDKFDFYEPEDPTVLGVKGAFYAVADGMGGHSAGQIACELALKTVLQSYYSNPSTDTLESLRRAIEEANALVYGTAQTITERQGMGTTLTAAVVREDQLTIAQVGDSRAYLLRNGDLVQITEDHSWVAEQVRLGVMTAEDAQNSPFRNIITRSVGTAQTVEADINTRTLQVGDTLLLCSDGLTGHVEPDEIMSIIADQAPSVAAQRLIEAANQKGGRDNITALILSVRGITPLTFDTDSEIPDNAPQGDDLVPAAGKTEKRGWGRRK